MQILLQYGPYRVSFKRDSDNPCSRSVCFQHGLCLWTDVAGDTHVETMEMKERIFQQGANDLRIRNFQGKVVSAWSQRLR